jgi:UDP-3-O-[3-hydroxymyristoyl] glucosamine N-acyltransferase
VGDHSILAAQVGIADNVRIGDQSILMARTGVISDLEGKQTYWGFPAAPYKQEARTMALRRKLPDLAAEVARLAKRVAELENRLKEDKDAGT